MRLQAAGHFVPRVRDWTYAFIFISGIADYNNRFNNSCYTFSCTHKVLILNMGVIVLKVVLIKSPGVLSFFLRKIFGIKKEPQI